MVPGKGSPQPLWSPPIINQQTGGESGDSNQFRKLWDKVLINSRVPPALFRQNELLHIGLSGSLRVEGLSSARFRVIQKECLFSKKKKQISKILPCLPSSCTGRILCPSSFPLPSFLKKFFFFMLSDSTSHPFIPPCRSTDSAPGETAQAEVTNTFLLAKPRRFFTPYLTDLSAGSDLLNTHSLHCSHESTDVVSSGISPLSLDAPSGPLYEPLSYAHIIM